MKFISPRIKREIKRIYFQVKESPRNLYGYTIETGSYDRKKSRKIKGFQGRLPISDRIAIFLMYPKGGLKPSHLQTFNYFNKKGYAVFGVSNLSLSEEDRATLLNHCWFYIERPNFGYDFGGYRDGILSLSDRFETLERLVLLNDSTWFPIPGTRDWIDDVEALNVDFAGAVANSAVPRPKIEDFRTMEWSYDSTRRNFHYCSFAFCMRPAVFRDVTFLEYWKNLRLSDNKRHTVRRGEFGFSQWMLRRGFSHGATLDITHLDQKLAKLSDEDLQRVAKNLVVYWEREELRHLYHNIITDQTTSREDLEKMILLIVSYVGPGYVLSSYTIGVCGFPFLKKSPLWLSPESARTSLAILEGIKDNGGAAILAEAKKLAHPDAL